ncbi:MULTISPECIES: glutamate ABC transporter substrate-binding protein [unclassified Streptomyces]|jgi:polar amino acid transport system substrate-binding protein|uniref:glutamate ABC transporter substrate-binding protein n=1 Tax=unclassified Streptomyces TaxID=2593676 RepID=UPI002251B811|nr:MULTISPECIES: glutamate ABC transporter substrate-binding protein [unclassified Streptomyces]MCX5133142.1 glutamate ABC transporter substrate-binding protein [Streptomyces sp. NBC_00340]
MIARRLRASLRGWGGVGAMAVACAVALVFALLLPLSDAHGEGGAGLGGQGLGRGTQATAEKCTDPQDRSPAPSSADGPTIEAIKARKDRRLIVGVDQNSYRWGYRDPNNPKAGSDLEGFDIDLVHAIAEDILGDPDAVQFRAIPTSQRISAVKDGTVDMVVRTMTITCDRLKDVAFSAPYFKTGQQVLAPDSSSITGYDKSLAGKRICAASGSTALAKLTTDKMVASATVITVPNQLDCLVRLQLGEADAVVTDGALAASQAAQDPTVRLKGDTFTTEYYGVAMRKDSDDLVRRVNQILADYRKNGWRQSYDKWLAPTLKDDSPSKEPPTVHYE